MSPSWVWRYADLCLKFKDIRRWFWTLWPFDVFEAEKRGGIIERWLRDWREDAATTCNGPKTSSNACLEVVRYHSVACVVDVLFLDACGRFDSLSPYFTERTACVTHVFAPLSLVDGKASVGTRPLTFLHRHVWSWDSEFFLLGHIRRNHAFLPHRHV